MPWSQDANGNKIMAKLRFSIIVCILGVITQQVSCELGVSTEQESVLACILYLTRAIGGITAGPISKRLVDTIIIANHFIGWVV